MQWQCYTFHTSQPPPQRKNIISFTSANHISGTAHHTTPHHIFIYHQIMRYAVMLNAMLRNVRGGVVKCGNAMWNDGGVYGGVL